MAKDKRWLEKAEWPAEDCKCFLADQHQFWDEAEDQILDESEARIKLLLAK